MAATPEEAARITNLETQFASFLAGTLEFGSLNGTQKRTIIESIFPNGLAIDINDPNLKMGDKVFGEKTGINGGRWFFGIVTTAPPTQDSHIDFKYQTI